MEAVAFYDYGRWVANCPNPACTNALALERGQEQWLCRFQAGTPQVPRWEGCGTSAPIVWPDNATAIERDLASLPESAQHWEPSRD